MSPPPTWLPFSDESLAAAAADEEQLQALEGLWREALSTLGIRAAEEERFLKLVGGHPHFNSTLLAATVDRGAISGLLLHWRIEGAISGGISKVPSPRVRSLALGLCMQILLMRLPKHEPEQLAAWLLHPVNAPHIARRTLRLLLELEKRRQELSPCWQDFFKSSARDFTEPDPSVSLSGTPPLEATVWNGLAASAGTVEGRYRYIAEPYAPLTGSDQGSLILIFGKARPDTVNFFPGASAVLYAEGGLLSHACCVAREQGLPCVTALGRGFLASVRARPAGRLRLESTASSGLGKVQLLPDG